MRPIMMEPMKASVHTKWISAADCLACLNHFETEFTGFIEADTPITADVVASLCRSFRALLNDRIVEAPGSSSRDYALVSSVPWNAAVDRQQKELALSRCLLTLHSLERLDNLITSELTVLDPTTFRQAPTSPSSEQDRNHHAVDASPGDYSNSPEANLVSGDFINFSPSRGSKRVDCWCVGTSHRSPSLTR